MNTLDLPIWRLSEAADDASDRATAEAGAAGVPVAGLTREKRQSFFARHLLKRAGQPGRRKIGTDHKLPGKHRKHGRG